MHMRNKYGCHVREVDEYLTTKTCSNCGNIKKMGTRKVYKCRCGMKTGRDENSAKTYMKLGIQIEQKERTKERQKRADKKELTKKKAKHEKKRRKLPAAIRKRKVKESPGYFPLMVINES